MTSCQVNCRPRAWCGYSGSLPDLIIVFERSYSFSIFFGFEPGRWLDIESLELMKSILTASRSPRFLNQRPEAIMRRQTRARVRKFRSKQKRKMELVRKSKISKNSTRNSCSYAYVKRSLPCCGKNAKNCVCKLPGRVNRIALKKVKKHYADSFVL